jgi:FkbM family methyltransferase
MTKNRVAQSLAYAGKRILWGRSGEPYDLLDQQLRFVVGTRPVRTKYRNSSNMVNRYDALQIEWLIQNIQPGAICIDVGGHTGECAIIMAALAKKTGQVVTFEPDPAARRVLQRNIQLNPEIGPISVESYAISDCVGDAQLFNGKGNANSALAAVGSVTNAHPITIKTMTLDTFLSANAFSPPNVVKIDIEGAEIHALRGARALLRSAADILVELHPYAWGDYGVCFGDFLDVIQAGGREAVYLDEQSPVIREPRYGTVRLIKQPTAIFA